MKLNTDPRKGLHFMNVMGIVLSSNKGQGKGDSLGRTAVASLIFDEDREELLDGCMSFFCTLDAPDRPPQTYVTRYPDSSEVKWALMGNSRDHVIKCISALKILGWSGCTRFLIHTKTPRPSIRMPYTIDQKVWFKAVYSRFWSWVYLGIMGTNLSLTRVYNGLIYLIGGYRSAMTPKEYIEMDIKPNSVQKKLNKILVPTFAFYYTIFAVRALEAKIPRKILLRILRSLFEKHNYVCRGLCGQKIPASVLESYIPSYGYRWNIRLDQSCNRTITLDHYSDTSSSMELAMLNAVVNKPERIWNKS